MYNKFGPQLMAAVELIGWALDDNGISNDGKCFGPNQYIFNEVGTISDVTSTLSVSYDLHVSDGVKGIVAAALSEHFEDVSYCTDARYRDSYGQWHVDDIAFIMYVRDLLQRNTGLETQKILLSLLCPELSESKTTATIH